MSSLLPKPLTRRRIFLAFATAIACDAMQMLLGPAGWFGLDEAVDVMAMSLLTLLIGFHPLFLPTFLVEFFPVADMLPTWTACVAVVVSLRRKQRTSGRAPSPQPPPPGVIDI